MLAYSQGWRRRPEKLKKNVIISIRQRKSQHAADDEMLHDDDGGGHNDPSFPRLPAPPYCPWINQATKTREINTVKSLQL